MINSEQAIEYQDISWAAYHASRQERSSIVPAVTALLPLFPDDSTSAAMIRHSMTVVKKVVNELNPGQIPVVTLDQPLYAIAKQIQWCWPADFGEDKFVIMLGGLHIEMAILKVLGNWLEDSGWTNSLCQAKIASSGTADSFLKASHVTKTRHAHQVTAATLYLLMQQGYIEYTESIHTQGEVPVSFESWCMLMREQSPMFHFWYTTFHLELLMLVFVRSLREGTFRLYIDSLTKLLPWFFALDHTHYSRWLPIHVRDMASLKMKHPDIAIEFEKGNFAVCKTHRKFSAMSIDQAHEQNNALVKGGGGAVGLTQNPAALRKWMCGGPEIARLIKEFESAMEESSSDNVAQTMHHEQTKGVQATFAKHVKALTGVLEKLGNPFVEESNDLMRIDTRDIADEVTVQCIKQAEKLGEDQYATFIKERLVGDQKHHQDPIKRNKLALFSRPPVKEVSKSKLQVASLKSNCHLFSRLYIACQVRDGNIDKFFEHENQACPPSLSLQGKLRQCQKSQLLECLEKYAESQTDAPTQQVIILDGAAIVNILRPVGIKTFKDYAMKVFTPFIESQLRAADRVDIVWDEYIDNSLKFQTRSKRGKGIRRRVESTSPLPSNWQAFLRIDENKVELFAYLADCISELATSKELITTKGQSVICNKPRDLSRLCPCNHEEADTRVILHSLDAFENGFNEITIRTVDTDVVAVAIAAFQKMEHLKFWIAFGAGKNLRYIPVHEIASTLGPEKAMALPMFHAFTGCDTVSSFANVGKKCAWETWNQFDDVTKAFHSISEVPTEIEEESITLLERIVILFYDRTSQQTNIDKARKELFTKKGRIIENIPPTKGALIQHIKRAVLQGGHC